ncbi:MAG: enoyl-CoA hydratase/isomerase family protein [Xanthobacteraceae bacterium]|nr:enoyl-CoA hydratase/isomerase family protein [Xanthobacteraceae bacterium]
MSGSVTQTTDGSVATVVIENEGRLNALSLPMWRQLRQAFEGLSHDRDTVRCIVLRGAGEAFASGADIAEFERERYDIESARAYGKAIHPALVAISNCPHPVIAMIHGPCVGGGLEIASRADIRIAGEGARFGVPVNRLGLVVAYAELKALLDIVGPSVALEMLLEGKIVGAKDAASMRLVNRVVPDAKLENEVYETAKRISEGAPLAARWHKKFVRRLLEPKPLREDELDESFDCFGTEDFKIGYRAFLEKKKPQFKGR